MLRMIVASVLACSLPAQTVVYSNGPFVSHDSGGPANAPRSQVQHLTGPALSLIGVGTSGTGWALADNFTVGAPLLVSAVEVYGYVDDVALVHPLAVPSGYSEFELSIWNGDPRVGTPAQLVPGAGPGVNLVATGTFSVVGSLTGVYRVSEGNPVDDTQEIQAVRVTLPSQLMLPSGTYWIGFRAKPAGSSFASFLGIPLTTQNVSETGDAIRRINNWASVTSSSQPQGMPFQLLGTPTQPVGAITNLGGGCSAVPFTVGGAPVPGGYFHAEIDTNSGLNGILFSTGAPNVPVPGCSCTTGQNLMAIVFGSQVTFRLPFDATLYGAALFVQGMRVDAGAACTIPGLLPLELTDAHRFSL